MKVCPSCDAINEEKNAIKCAVCGRDISKELEFDLEALDDPNFLEEIDFKNKLKKRKNKTKKILITSLVMIFMICMIVVYVNLEPRGHINIVKTYWEIEIGDVLPIEIEYSEKLSRKNLRIELVTSNYKDLGEDEYSYYFDVIDDKYCLVALKEDTLQFTFWVKDDGTQAQYNNTITIVIISKELNNE